MIALDPHRPDALPHAYSVWHRRTLAAALVGVAVGFAALAPTVEYRVEFGDGPVSTWLVLGAVSLAVGSLGPLLVGFGLALAALGSRRLGRSCRLARWAWVVWVLGPLPVPGERHPIRGGLDARGGEHPRVRNPSAGGRIAPTLPRRSRAARDDRVLAVRGGAPPTRTGKK